MDNYLVRLRDEFLFDGEPKDLQTTQDAIAEALENGEIDMDDKDLIEVLKTSECRLELTVKIEARIFDGW